MINRRVLAGAALVGSLLPVLSCSDSATSPPDDGVVRGTVVARYADLPLVGAAVRIADQEEYTNAQGIFQFPHVPQGPAVLTVTANDHAPHQRALEVGAWQSVDISLMPADSLATVSGRIYHEVDGPLQLVFTLAGQEVRSDSDGLWSLADVPLGPAILAVNTPPYNALESQVMILTEGQELPIRLTRDISLVRSVEHDAYICTEDDSLNANRGQVTLLQATPALGRTALFLFPELDDQWAGAEIHAATLILHANLRPQDDEWDGPGTATMQLGWVDEPFFENAVDGVQRPSWTVARSQQVTLVEGFPDQLLTLDVSGALGPGDPAAGVAVGVPSGDVGVGFASSEFGDDDQPEADYRPRVEYIVRY